MALDLFDGFDGSTNTAHVPCSLCINILQELLGLINQRSFLQWIENQCKQGLTHLFQIDGHVCKLVSTYSGELLHFAAKYTPLFLCHHWNYCNTDQASKFASGELMDDQLSCEACQDGKTVVLQTIAKILRQKRKEICYLFEVIEFDLGCHFIDMDDTYIYQIIYNFIKYTDIEDICPSCTTTENTPTDSVTVTEEVTEFQPTTSESPLDSNGFLNRPQNSFLFQIVNEKSEKCLTQHNGNVVVSDCTCYFCAEEEKNPASMKWFKYGSSLVNYEEGKVLEAKEANGPVILSTFDPSRQNQNWVIFPLPEEGQFAIISGVEHLRLAQLEDSLGLTFVKIGVLPPSGEDKEFWSIKILE